MNIDLTKLQNVRKTPNGIEAACPKCTEEGVSISHRHLFIYPSGRFGCIKNKNHSKGIWDAIGVKSGAITTPVEEVKQDEPLKMEKVYSKDLLNKLFPMWTLFTDQGISSETLKLFQCGFCHGGNKLTQRIVFPVFNLKNDIIGFSGRYFKKIPPDNVPKWKHIESTKKFLFPIHISDKFITETKTVYILESIGNAM